MNLYQTYLTLKIKSLFNLHLLFKSIELNLLSNSILLSINISKTSSNIYGFSYFTNINIEFNVLNTFSYNKFL